MGLLTPTVVKTSWSLFTSLDARLLSVFRPNQYLESQDPQRGSLLLKVDKCCGDGRTYVMSAGSEIPPWAEADMVGRGRGSELCGGVLDRVGVASFSALIRELVAKGRSVGSESGETFSLASISWYLVSSSFAGFVYPGSESYVSKRRISKKGGE